MDDDAVQDATKRCLRLLAGVCDGARLRDGQGFNGRDAPFGHSLAAQTWSLTSAQLAAARRMLRKYRRQLPADDYAIVVGATNDENARAPSGGR